MATNPTAPTPKEPSMLDEAANRAPKFMLLGTRREGGQMAPVTFKDTEVEANAAADTLTSTGWSTVEIYKLVGAHRRKK